ncbi:MAG: hypothetical protein CVV23_15445 [Ignavibacteriae bacterium HGW-Ignavibacteriae-2]|jgi:hypothetical protein|nr:hypothetical protein [Bacteroidota bacterium]PKL87435.1 MAG: hypothetical protein CVV23_15445 [Ignavibacteriae bacterium HGW-Ignavibacteriae-2]
MHLDYHINNIKHLFNEAALELDKITTDEFDTHFNNAKSNMILIRQLRKELKQNFPNEQLKKNDEELINLAKLIEKKYDDIIEEFIEERNILAIKLGTVSNQKKIAQYSR